MKKLLLVVLSVFCVNCFAAGTPTKVCHTVKNKQVCKMIKMHKKLDIVTKIPVKKK